MMIVEGIGLGFKSINLNNKSLNFSMDLMFEVTIEMDFPSGNEKLRANLSFRWDLGDPKSQLEMTKYMLLSKR
jgi:hypothetical protein